MMFSNKSFRLNSVISFHYTNAVVTAGKVTPLVYAKPVSRNEERGTFTAAVFDDEGQGQVIDDRTGKPKFRQYRIENCAFTADDLLAMGYCPNCKHPLSDGCEYSESSDDCASA